MQDLKYYNGLSVSDRYIAFSVLSASITLRPTIVLGYADGLETNEPMPNELMKPLLIHQ